MRVISGTARGRKIKTLEGLETRPTTDRIKESVFNIIQFDIPGRRVLDLFAGSGQLAIEAVSRGAREAIAIDSSSSAIKIIKENILSCKFADTIRAVQADYKTYLKSNPGKFDVIFLDPPYSGEMINNALELIEQIDILSEGGIIVCETERDKELVALKNPYVKGKDYLYGKTKITIYRKG